MSNQMDEACWNTSGSDECTTNNEKSDTSDHNDELGDNVPKRDELIKPALGMEFNSLDEAEKFYVNYAQHLGFTVRRGTSHKFPRSSVDKSKYYICSREGKKNSSNSTGKRRTTSSRFGCKARIALAASKEGGAYVVKVFEDEHNHELISSYARHLQKERRRINIGHQKFMLSCAKANLGPVKSYKLYKEIIGSFSNISAMSSDFKNLKRDINEIISPADAQMVLNRFKVKKDICYEFYYEYDVNECGQLVRLFWCDPVSRRNYAAFGEVVSFNSTYRTNRYCTVFSPFTSLDNHKCCVTFAGGLLLKEDVESYEWLLTRFLNAMRSPPRVIVIDQDPSMKIAIQNVLPQTRHRLCMWHIMTKVSKKVGAKKINSNRFRKRLHDAVWNVNKTVHQFEEDWESFIVEHDLAKNKWLSNMYAMRAFWIEAYFRNVLLGGLVRTTSISKRPKVRGILKTKVSSRPSPCSEQL